MDEIKKEQIAKKLEKVNNENEENVSDEDDEEEIILIKKDKKEDNFENALKLQFEDAVDGYKERVEIMESEYKKNNDDNKFKFIHDDEDEEDDYDDGY